jgi:hypothetical protein
MRLVLLSFTKITVANDRSKLMTFCIPSFCVLVLEKQIKRKLMKISSSLTALSWWESIQMLAAVFYKTANSTKIVLRNFVEAFQPKINFKSLK